MTRRYLTVLALVFSAGAAAQLPFPMNEKGDVRWVCAGIGEGEREALAKMEAGTSLKLLFAAGKRGEYLTDVDVVLSDSEGKRPALKFIADGPICLIQAPAGRYRLEASFKDEKRGASTTVARDARQPGMVVFRFPEAN